MKSSFFKLIGVFSVDLLNGPFINFCFYYVMSFSLDYCVWKVFLNWYNFPSTPSVTFVVLWFNVIQSRSFTLFSSLKEFSSSSCYCFCHSSLFLKEFEHHTVYILDKKDKMVWDGVSHLRSNEERTFVLCF